MANDNEKIEARTFTEEELELTKEEHLRNMARMAIDIGNMMSMGMPQKQAEIVGKLRYDQRASWITFPILLNDIPTACVGIEAEEGRMALFAVLQQSHDIKASDGTSISDKMQEHIDKRTLN